MGIIKMLGGITKTELKSALQNQMNATLANIVQQNLYHFLGKDMPVVNWDNFDYVAEGYLKVPHVYEAVSIVVNKLAACPLTIYEVKDKTKLQKVVNAEKSGNLRDYLKAKTDALVEVDVPRIRQLLDNPNPEQTPDAFIRTIATLLLVSGNALAYGFSGDERSKKLSEIWALPFNPTQYKIKSGGFMKPVESYAVNANMGRLTMEMDASKVAHFKTVNPLWTTSGAQLYGLSPLHAYISKLLRSQLGDDAANRLLKNGFKIGLVTPKFKEDDWSEPQGKAVRNSLANAASSSSAYGRIVAASHALDYTPIGLDSTELGLLDLAKADREDIFAAYQIPRLMASTDASTFNNFEAMGRKLIYDAVAPYATLIGDMLTKFICTPFEKADGKKYIIRLDYLSLPELTTDMKDAAEWLSKSPYLTMNEKREVQGWGRLDQPGMDEIILDRSAMLLSQIMADKNIQQSRNNNQNQQDSE